MRHEVKTLDDLDPVMRSIRAMHEIKGHIDVIIKEHSETRRTAQNGLMWQWLTDIGNATGESKERLHEIYKEKFLCNIFIRDDPGYAEMALAIKAVRATSEAHYKALKREVVKLTSTTKCSVKQMSEYLNAIKEHATFGGLRINLTEPSMQGLV